MRTYLRGNTLAGTNFPNRLLSMLTINENLRSYTGSVLFKKLIAGIIFGSDFKILDWLITVRFYKT